MPLLEERSIEILAEINHAPRLSDDELLRQADDYRKSGADVIDLGCIPGEPWTTISNVPSNSLRRRRVSRLGRQL